MIGYVKGKIIAKGTNYLIVENGGLGYKVNTGSFPKGNVGNEAEFFCYHYVREDADELFGFENFEALEFFELLLGVSGVGPKVAQTILNNLSRAKIIQAIEGNDLNLFKSIPGVGTKVAAKIIVELKNKVGKGQIDLSLIESDETVDALVALGLKKAEILPALKLIPPEITSVQDKIKFVLKNVAKS